MKYYLIAGERSGDLHGANLIKALKKEDPDAVFRGVGGDYMKNAGADIVVHYQEMAMMGYIDVVKNIFKFQRYLSFCQQDIRQYQPDAIIFIDFAGFNLRIAKKVKGFHCKKFYYIAPKIWAWKQKRAITVRETIDRAFVILPFEEQFYAKYQVDAKYVGNPVMDEIDSFQADEGFWAKHKIIDTDGIVALLPGSRKQEVLLLLPKMIEVARAFPTKTFGLSIVSNLPHFLYDHALKEPNIVPVYEDNYNLLTNASAAVVTSGTATLETALFDVPQVVVYKTSTINYNLGKLLIKVDFISLVNLIMGKEIVKELIQDELTTHAIANELGQILENNSRRAAIRTSYQELRSLLSDGNASANTAFEIIKALRADN